MLKFLIYFKYIIHKKIRYEGRGTHQDRFSLEFIFLISLRKWRYFFLFCLKMFLNKCWVLKHKSFKTRHNVTLLLRSVFIFTSFCVLFLKFSYIFFDSILFAHKQRKFSINIFTLGDGWAKNSANDEEKIL